MALTADERIELHRIEKAARDLRAKKNAESKERMAASRKVRAKAVDRSRPEQRQPPARDTGYLAFLRRLPCIAGVMGLPDCEGATQAAHLRFSDAAQGRRNPGMGNKPSDRHATPLCAHHHLRDQHARQEQAFWNGLGIDPGDLSAALYAAYLADDDGLAVLHQFAPGRTPA
jgi:hypothetical protein